MHKIKYSFLAAAFFFSLPLYGQLEGGERRYTVDYKPNIKDAQKIEVVPANENLETKTPEMTYQTPAVLLKQEPYKERLRALRYEPPIPDLYQVYGRLGFGNYSDFLTELYYNSLRNDKGAFSAMGKWHSGKGPVNESNFHEAQFGVYGKYIMKKTVLSGDINYKNNAIRYYGVPDDWMMPDTPANRQRYSDLNLSAMADNSLSDKGLRWKGGFDFYTFGDMYDAKETNVGLFVAITEPIGKGKVIGDARFDFMPYNGNERSLFRVNLAYRFDVDRVRLTAGFRTAKEGDTMTTEGEGGFHFYPNVYGELDIAETAFTLFGALRGNLQRTTFRDLAYMNSFIASNVELRNVNEKMEISGGIKGSAGKLGYLGQIGFHTYDNFYFFNNDSADIRRFVPLYDDGNTTLLRIHGEASISLTEAASVNIWTTLNNYGVSDELQKPLHTPLSEFGITGAYTKKDEETGDPQLRAHADVFLYGKRYALNPTTDQLTTLKGIIDLNAGVEYNFAQLNGLGAYIQAQNILGTKYQLWNNYPVRGFQIRGGIVFRFLPSSRNKR